jgi:site-specific DNA recombinase
MAQMNEGSYRGTDVPRTSGTLAEHHLHVRSREEDLQALGEIAGAQSDAPKGSRAVLYLRVSSKGQVNTDYDPEGISIPAQRLACAKRAEQLGYNIVEEYVEPGRSATEMTKRVAFQQMLARIRREKDVDAVIVYKLSRFARNRTDDAIVMADLQKRGVTLISATESIDETPVGQLMHGILSAFNEYRSREDGADISYKMGQKAKNGGTIGRAPIGYLNTLERYEGREIRSIEVDPERARFVRLAFELYADGEHSMDEIADELSDRGLVTRPTERHPAGPVSVSKLSRMLRDQYYLGRVVYKGAVYDGRHPAIVPIALFERVQDLLTTRGVAGERRRLYDHYLKGTLWCGHCFRDHDVRTSRMIIQRATGKTGGEYFYFFCRAKQEGRCDSRFIPTHIVEERVVDHYKTVRFVPSFIADVRAALTDALANQEETHRLLRSQLEQRLRALSVKADNLIDLAADGEVTGDRVRAKLREIERQRAQIKSQLDSVVDDLSAGARLIDGWLTLLENPYELYKDATDETRRKLNHAIFKRIFVCSDEVVGHELNEPIAELMTVQAALGAGASTGELNARWEAIVDVHTRARGNRQATKDDLLTAVDPVEGWSKPSMVPLEGLEPPTVSLGRNCSSIELQRPEGRPRKSTERRADG